VRLVAADLWRQYHDAFGLGCSGQRLSVLLPRIEDGVIAGFDTASATELIPAKWRKKLPQPEAARIGLRSLMMSWRRQALRKARQCAPCGIWLGAARSPVTRLSAYAMLTFRRALRML